MREVGTGASVGWECAGAPGEPRAAGTGVTLPGVLPQVLSFVITNTALAFLLQVCVCSTRAEEILQGLGLLGPHGLTAPSSCCSLGCPWGLSRVTAWPGMAGRE